MAITALIIGIAILGLPAIVVAGASNASLECQAMLGNGDISLAGSIPGDFSEFELSLKNLNGVDHMADTNGTISVITDFDEGVFTLSVTMQDARTLSLYAIPRSVRAQGGTRREVKARFDAILLEAPKPGYQGPMNYDSVVRDVPLTCTFEHAT